MRKELGVFMNLSNVRRTNLIFPADRRKPSLSSFCAQRRAYNDLADDLSAELPDGSVLKAQDGSRTTHPFTAGGNWPQPRHRDIDDSCKLDLAVELIEDNQDEAFVVFSWYKAAGPP